MQWPLRQKNNVISVYRPDDTLQNQQSPPEYIKNLVKKTCVYKNLAVYKLNFTFPDIRM
jgi:hypothetical protein